MKRIKLIIQYLGTNYAGWQVQPNNKTIQGEIQNAIQLALGEDVIVEGSGRTDAGVHALGQVAHFDTNTKMNSDKIYAILNRYLPEDIRVLKSEEVSEDFHARFSPKRKTYEYHFYCSEVNMPIYDKTHAKVRFSFDFDLAKQVCKYFIGEHDFKAFCSANTKVKDTTRIIYDMSLNRNLDGTYFLSVTGNGFLYNMVRIIAGTIIEVGCGKIAVGDIPQIIQAGERSKAGRTAQPQGLILKSVEY